MQIVVQMDVFCVMSLISIQLLLLWPIWPAASLRSRIDFWLISKSIDIRNTFVDILPTPLTDHKAIFIKIKLSVSTLNSIKPSYWKINGSLLSHNSVKLKINYFINHYWEKAVRERSFSNNWELLKFDISKFMRRYGSELAKLRKAEEEAVVSEIAAVTQGSPENLSNADAALLCKLQNQLDDIYKRKAEDAFVRSRRRWMEQGEQNSAYFLRLEKSNATYNSLSKLIVDGIVTDDPKTISDYCNNFYKLLYTSRFDEDDTSSFLDSIVDLITIEADDKNRCDDPISLKEIVDSINHLKVNKSPGNDGITAEFYKAFYEPLAPFLAEVYAESILKTSLPPSLTQGVITLIPKPKKYPLLIENWRPICLLNTDYKILALILAQRLQKVMSYLIDESQSGFIKNRHISNNIRLILDLLDYSDLISEESFIFFFRLPQGF